MPSHRELTLATILGADGVLVLVFVLACSSPSPPPDSAVVVPPGCLGAEDIITIRTSWNADSATFLFLSWCSFWPALRLRLHLIPPLLFRPVAWVLKTLSLYAPLGTQTQTVCVCVGGPMNEIRDINSNRLNIFAGSSIEGAVFMVSHYKDWAPSQFNKAEENRRARELEEWLKGRQTGDLIVAECEIDRFVTPEWIMYEPGTPSFGQCKLVK